MRMQSYFMIIIAALLLALANQASALDISQPATVNIIVRDPAGKGVAGVKISLARRFKGHLQNADLAATTDAQGRVQLIRPVPADGYIWEEQLTAETNGYLKVQDPITLFPAAQVEKTLTLDPKHNTLIRVLDPAGQPVSAADLAMSYENSAGQTNMIIGLFDNEMLTDAHGEYVWEHGTLAKGFDVSLGSFRQHADDVPLVTINLTQQEMNSLPQPRTLEGTLLAPDGSPAKGWYVADRARGSGWLSFGGLVIDSYDATNLLPVTADGKFSRTVNAGSCLIIVSPQGVPLLYDLAPQNWEPGIHHITLSVPVTRSALRGQIVDESGKPVPGLGLRAQNLSTRGRNWDFRTAAGGQGEMLSDGKVIGVSTDDQGRYSIPIPCGAWLSLGVNREGGYLINSSRIDGFDHQVMKFIPEQTPLPRADVKDVSIQAADEHGAVIAEANIDINPGGADSALIATQNSNAVDSRGRHFFVRKTVASLDIEITIPGWKKTTRTLDIHGADDHHEIVALDADQRLKPLRGRLRDPAGNPVAGATIYAMSLVTEDKQRTLAGLGLMAQSDANGTFSFTGLPDECVLDIVRYDGTGNNLDLPGWIEPFPVTAAARDIEVKLKPVGSIKILLPADFPGGLEQLSATAQNADGNDLTQWVTLTFDAQAHALVAPWVRPGVFDLREDSVPVLGILKQDQITVKEGTETLIDWRHSAIPAWATQPQRWTTLSVSADQKLVCGVQVAVYTDQYRPELVRQWIEDWRAGDASAKARAEIHLAKAGATAREILETFNVDPTLAPLADKLKVGPNQWPIDGLVPVTTDLSDAQGSLRFQGQVGRQYIAIAHVPGKWLGWQRFTIAATGDITVNLKPTRRLVTHLPPLIPATPRDSDSREIELRFVDPAGIERRGLMRFFVGDFGPYGSEGEHIRSELIMSHADQDLDRSIDDLPIGATLQFNGRYGWGSTGKITISPGDEPQELKFNQTQP